MIRAIKRRRWIAAATAVGFLLAAGLTTAAVTRSDAGGDDSPLMVAPSTVVTSTTVRPTTTTIGPLPQPQPPPVDPYADSPIVQIGTVEIPRIGLVHPVYEGITLTVIDHGPGHWPGSGCTVMATAWSEVIAPSSSARRPLPALTAHFAPSVCVSPTLLSPASSPCSSDDGE